MWVGDGTAAIRIPDTLRSLLESALHKAPPAPAPALLRRENPLCLALLKLMAAEEGLAKVVGLPLAQQLGVLP